MLMGCTDDLSTKSMAPSSSPRSVTSAPSWVRVDISRTAHRLLGHEPLEGLEAAEPRHPDVEGDDVGAQLAGLREPLLAVRGEAHHLDVVHRPEHPLDGLADERGVVHHEDADPTAPGHGRGSSGFWYTMAPWKRIGTKALDTRASDSAWPRKR